MKKNILASLLLATALAYSDETSQNLYNHSYVLSENGQKIAYEYVVSTQELYQCFKDADLAAFKTCQKRFEERGLRIFSIIIHGTPLLALAIGSVTNWQNPGRTELFDYIVSQVTVEELNMCHNVDFTTYLVPAVAFAALTSPYCLNAILKHPLLDATSFFTESALTPEKCIALLQNSQVSINVKDDSKKLIEILKKQFNI